MLQNLLCGGVAILLAGGCGEDCGDAGENGKNDGASGSSRSIIETLNRPNFRIGVPQSATSTTLGEMYFPKAKLLYFTAIPDGYTAVQSRKIDAFLFDRHCMEYAAKHKENVMLLPENIGRETIVIGFPKSRPQLRDQVNAFIRQYRADGTYREMYQRWIEAKTPPRMPDIPTPVKPTGKYLVGTNGMNEPMNYFGKDGKLTGFDIEFVKRLALYLNAEIEIVTMRYGGLLPATVSGRIDMLVANMNATPGRGEKMLLSDEYIDSAVAVMVHKDSAFAAAPDGEIRSLADLKGKKAASLTGTGFWQLTEPLQPGIEHVFFNDNNSSVQALRAGKVAAVLLDEPISRLWASRFPDLRVVCIYAKDNYGFAFRKNSPLTAKAGAVIRQLKQSGELRKMTDKWCNGPDSGKKLTVWTHKKDFSGKNGVLRYASDVTQEPMCYTDAANQPAGLDIEIMRRIAYELDMKLEFVPMNFGALLEALTSGRVDGVGGSMSITEERKKRVDFAESYYEGGLSIFARKVPEHGSGEIAKVTDLSGKRVGTMTNGTLKSLTDPLVSGVNYFYFGDPSHSLQALLSGKLDACLYDEPVARNFVAKFPGKLRIACVYVEDHYAFAARKKSPLIGQINAILQKMNQSGELKSLVRKWCDGPLPERKLTDWRKQIPGTGKNGVLRFAAPPIWEPMCYVGGNNEVIGLDMDIIYRIAAELDWKVEFIPIDSNARIEMLNSGKADLVGGSMSVTEERKRAVDFSTPHYDGGVAILTVCKAETREKRSVFLHGLKSGMADLRDSFERTFIRENRWKLVWQGLQVTVLITILAAILGTALAFPVCFMRRSKKWLWRRLGAAYVALMQGTPILVILMILYYIIFAGIDIDAVLVAVIGFGLNFAAYAGEMLRTGIDAVPKGQSEAAAALGFSKGGTFVKVVLPQALRQVLPVYRGEFINMLKTTSIVGYIAIQDLTKMSDIIRSRTYEAFFPLIATAVIYFAVAWVLASFLGVLERRLDPVNRRGLRTGGAK